MSTVPPQEAAGLVITKLIALPSLIVTEAVAVHPLASVTTTL